jgi:NADH-quinone oxidoreductase subunit D
MSDKTTFTGRRARMGASAEGGSVQEMEALIYHFKIVMGESDVPVGEVYHCVEGGNGELGVYLVSDGGRTPFRVHFRRPCFVYYQAFPEMVKGIMLSDAILSMSSMNVIAGELDA